MLESINCRIRKLLISPILDRLDKLETEIKRKRVLISHIENDVWINFGVTVFKGVTIGAGSVIAAGVLMAKDVQLHSMYRNLVQPMLSPLQKRG